MPADASPLALAVTVWTARAAVSGWFLAILAARRTGRAEWDAGPARIAWAFGVGALLVHSAAAFVLVHHGRLEAAWRHTAERTAEVTGLHWGGGLVINVLFAAWWLIDAVIVWRPVVPLWRQAAAYRTALHVTFAFLMINATVVFGPPHWKWIGVLAVAAWSATRPAGRRACDAR